MALADLKRLADAKRPKDGSVPSPNPFMADKTATKPDINTAGGIFTTLASPEFGTSSAKALALQTWDTLKSTVEATVPAAQRIYHGVLDATPKSVGEAAGMAKDVMTGHVPDQVLHVTGETGGAISDVFDTFLQHSGISPAIAGELKNMGTIMDGVSPDIRKTLEQGMTLTGKAYDTWAKLNPKEAKKLTDEVNTAKGLMILQGFKSGGEAIIEKGKTLINSAQNLTGPLVNEIPAGTEGALAASKALGGELPNLTQDIPVGTPGYQSAAEAISGEAPGLTNEFIPSPPKVPEVKTVGPTQSILRGPTNDIPAGTPGAKAAQEAFNAEPTAPYTEEQLAKLRRENIPTQHSKIAEGASPQTQKNMALMQQNAEALKNDPMAPQVKEVGGNAVIDAKDSLVEARRTTGASIEAEAKAMDQAPLSTSKAGDFFDKGLDDMGIVEKTNPETGARTLDFSDSTFANDTGAQKAITNVWDKLPDDNLMTPMQDITLRRQIANDLELFKNQKGLTNQVDGFLGKTRDLLNDPLTDPLSPTYNPKYAQLAMDYAKQSQALQRFYAEFGIKFTGSADDIAALRAGELLERLTNNSSAATRQAFEGLGNTARDYGYTGDVDFYRLAKWNNALREYYPEALKTDFASRVAQGVRQLGVRNPEGIGKIAESAVGLHPLKTAGSIFEWATGTDIEAQRKALWDLVSGGISSAQTQAVKSVGDSTLVDIAKNLTKGL